MRNQLRDDAPTPEAVLAALDDEGCRAILLAAEGSYSAQELSERADVPLSTTYRKLEQLTEAQLVAEETQIRTDGKHTTRYRTDFEAVRVALRDFEAFEVEIDRPEQTPDQQLADLWAQVREET
jgi:DNA-binding transcriptional ArsR family regulator